MSLIKLKNVSKFYNNNNNISSGFNKINLTLDCGEFVVITGESGSGKSTLLNVISGLDSYEEGEMYINDEETSHYSEEDYEIYRRKYIGNIFQNFNLINSYTVYQNIELVYLLNGCRKSEVRKEVISLIDTVGLSKYKNTKVSKLSGGQKQRVAIARVLAKDTPIIVADEPTGSLDQKNAKSTIELLHKISKDKLVVIVTHNYEQVEEYATRKITMSDGKIIEDKKNVKVDKEEAIETLYGNITLNNKINLGFRNAFNILTKFLLITAVYLFLVISTFSQYSNLRKIEYDQDATGYNTYFSDISSNRIVINKKDRTTFTKKDIEYITKLNNVESLEENDALIDLQFSMSNDDVYFYGNINNTKSIIGNYSGTLPTNDYEVLIEASNYDYYLSTYGESLIGKKISFTDDISTYINSEFTITGIKYKDNENIFYSSGDSTFYFNENMIKKLSNLSSMRYSTVYLEINNKKFKPEDMYFTIKDSNNLKKGEAYLFNSANNACKDFDCNNENIKLSVNDIYHEKSVTLKVKDIITKDNSYRLVQEKKYENVENILFISTEDYNELFEHDTYQISIYLKDTLKANATLKELDEKGYNTIYMRDVLVNELETVMGVLQIFRTIVFIISSVALFFISYFIIKLILKSRNIYYSTIRILGASKSDASSILRIELLLDLNLAFWVFIAFILLVNFGIVSSSYISEIINYFKLFDYLIIYIILNVMSLLISNRYANKLFKSSVMNTYREEV